MTTPFPTERKIKMKLYLISERDAHYLMRAPSVAGGYVVTGNANLS